MNVFILSRWSPYLIGVFIGVLSWISFLTSKRPIGVSTAFVRLSGLIESFIKGPKTKEKPYYKKFEPKIDWEVMLIIGVLIGSFLSAILSGQFEFNLVPKLWISKFGYTPVIRIVISLIGGFLVGLGARWSGGCTSGHGISGTMQLAISSWIAAVCFFIGGIITAHLIY